LGAGLGAGAGADLRKDSNNWRPSE
jgi:hypothetical protein